MASWAEFHTAGDKDGYWWAGQWGPNGAAQISTHPWSHIVSISKLTFFYFQYALFATCANFLRVAGYREQ